MHSHRYIGLFCILAIAGVLSASCQTNDNPKEAKSDPAKTRLKEHNLPDILPKPVGYINDYEHIFSNAEKAQLDSIIRDFEAKTTIQMAVVTLDVTMTTAENFDDYSLKIANAWGVGQQGKDNGILIAVSRGYKKIRIQNGYGIEPLLSNDATQQIVHSAFIPQYRETRYFEGTYQGIQALISALNKSLE